MRDVRVTVLSAYPFHMFDQARQLARLGALNRLVTTYPLGRTGLPPEFVRARMYAKGVQHYAKRALPSLDPFLSVW